MLEASFQTQLESVWRSFAGGHAALAVAHHRNDQRRSSRACLRKSRATLRELGGDSDAPVFTSLSHEPSLSIAIASRTEPSRFSVGIGVDAERSGRAIPREGLRWYIEDGEETFGLSTLEVWVVKEACFKANPQSRRTLLRDYAIDDWRPSDGIGTAICRKDPLLRWRFRLETRFAPYLFAFAIAERGA